MSIMVVSIPTLKRIFASCFLLIIFQAGSKLQAQYQESFTPMSLYSNESKELKEKIKAQLSNELEHFQSPDIERELIIKIFNERTDFLLRQVRGKDFIKNDSIEKFVSKIMNRVVLLNKLERRQRLILILNSPEVNAFCYGRGLYIVTIALLSRIKSEDELAFILCHELAHDELDHVQERIKQEVKTNLSKKTFRQIRKIITSKITLEDIESFRKMIYSVSKYSREKEIHADSLGFTFYMNSSYVERQAMSALFKLDSAKYPKYDSGEKFFLPFDFSDYPFQDYWLKSRLSIYSQEPGDTFMFSIDSVSTHPEFSIRTTLLESYIKGSNRQNYNNGQFRNIMSLAEFQTADAAFTKRQYDQSLYLLLQLKQLYPKNVYLNSRITKIMIDICQGKNSNMFGLYASKFTSGYGERLKQVNNFLFNLTAAECGELAYRFINNKENFNDENESHYYLLSKICELTNRFQLKDKIDEAFRRKFKKKMINYSYE